jgi:hypothetical protein
VLNVGLDTSFDNIGVETGEVNSANIYITKDETSR